MSAFNTKVLFQDEGLENVVSTVLILVGLKSFEFIIKTLLTSTRQESVNTGKYALEICADQAYNPLNYVKWWRGKPDFPHSGDKNFRKPIPLNRATLAVLICVIVLFVEAAFFYGTMSKNRPLTNKDFTLSVQRTPDHKKRMFMNNFCAPIGVETGRAKMTAVFAYCNRHESSGGNLDALAASRNLDIDFIVSPFSQTVRMTDTTKNVSITSETVFSILVPDNPEHLVVPYSNATNALIPNVHAMMMAYFDDKQGCVVNSAGRANGQYKLANCQHEVDLDYIMEELLSYTKVDTTSGEVKHELTKNRTADEQSPIVLGVIEEHMMTMVALLAVALSLLALSILCHFFVQNNNSEVIAAMMREKTLQDMRVPAFSMDEEIIHLDRATSDDEAGSTHKTVHLRQSVDAPLSTGSGPSSLNP